MGIVYPSSEIRIDPLGACPCESGKIMNKCCLRNGALRPRSALHGLSRPKTGYSHASCYAAPLADCSPDISREHFISNGILNLMNSMGTGFHIGGFHWQRGEKQKVPPKGLASNILCGRHNTALGPLDNVALRFFRALVRAYERTNIHINEDVVFLCNGHDFERWFLKMLCGAAFSGNLTIGGQVIKDWSPELRWLRILFGQESFPRGWGLYTPAKSGSTKSSRIGVSFGPYLNPQGAVVAAQLQLTTLGLRLAMIKPPKEVQGTPFDHAIYRPPQLNMYTEQENARFLFGWDIRGDNRGASYFLQPSIPDASEQV